MFNRGPDDNITSIRTRDRAADQNYFFFLAHLHDLEVLHGHTFVTQVPRHAHILPNSTRSRTIADGAVPTMGLRSVSRTLAVEVVLLHHTLETFALGAANHVHKLARLKLGDAQIQLAFRGICRQPKFADELLRFGAGLLEIADSLFR